MAAGLLLDTNVLVHIVRNSPDAEVIRERHAPLLVQPVPIVSIVSEAELRSLALQWNWGAAKLREIEFLLNYFGKYPIDAKPIAEAWAVIESHCIASGRKLSDNDLWVAATAHVTGRTLVTTDRDFEFLDPRFLNLALV
jgi:tRNA(fMet)-specific endonuclease VapC